MACWGPPEVASPSPATLLPTATAPAPPPRCRPSECDVRALSAGGCGHDFCRHCYEAWTKDFHQRTCPVCRAQLPLETPGICLRLKAAVEAVARGVAACGGVAVLRRCAVAARRRELQAEAEQKRQQRQTDAQQQQQQHQSQHQSQQQGGAEAAAQRAEAEARQAAASRWVQDLAARAAAREADSIEQQQRQAAALPCTLPLWLATTAPPANRQAEETRWLCYQMQWPQVAAQWESSDYSSYSRAMRVQAGAARASPEQGAAAAQLNTDRIHTFSVRRQLALMQALPPGLPAPAPSWPLPQHSDEVCCEESRWRCLQATAAAAAAAPYGSGSGSGGGQAAGPLAAALASQVGRPANALGT